MLKYTKKIDTFMHMVKLNDVFIGSMHIKNRPENVAADIRYS